ncbi:MAG: MG2 domain-containing protein [bacterium]
MIVTEHRCGWGNCSPYDAFTFYFSNPLEDSAFEDDLVQVSPEFPAMTISQSGGYIAVYGEKPGRRKYTVTLKAGLKDIFGQTLGKDQQFTFDVGAADPRLTAASGEFIVLDPKAGPQFTFYSINYDAVRLKAWEVQPTDWAQYREYLEDWRYYGKKKKLPPGRKVIDTEIKIKGSADELVQTNLDLTEVFGKDGLGNAVIELTPSRASKGSTMPDRDYLPMVRSWLNATKLGVDVMYDYEEALVWANDLATGAPVNGVEFTLVPTNAKGTTKDNGTAIVPLGNASGTASYVLAKKGDDIAMIPESYSGNYPYKYDPSKSLSWFVFDDRGMYKPKEEVHLKGWVRSVDQRKGGDLSLAAGTTSVKWIAYDAMNNKLAEGTTDTTALGGFDFNFVLPETPNLGSCRVEMTAMGGEHSGSMSTHYFQIQEFRTPEFEVSVHVPPGPFYANAEASARLEAKYYAGGALPNADVNWSITANASAFTPPNQSKYTFGVWVPWWRSGGMASSSSYANLSAKTDAAGEHFIKLDFGAAEPPRPMTVSLQGTAMDVNRQAWTGSATMLVPRANTTLDFGQTVTSSRRAHRLRSL